MILKNKSDNNKREKPHTPDWQMEVVRQRLADYSNGLEIAIDFDEAMDDIEKEL